MKMALTPELKNGWMYAISKIAKDMEEWIEEIPIQESETITALEQNVSDLEDGLLSVQDVVESIQGQVETLDPRVTALEERPIGGEVDPADIETAVNAALSPFSDFKNKYELVERVVTPEDNLAQIINNLSSTLPKADGSNTRNFGQQRTRLILTPGVHNINTNAIVTFDGFEMIGSGTQATEVRCNSSVLQLGVDKPSTANCHNIKACRLEGFTLTARGTIPAFDDAVDGPAGGWPRGVLDIRFFTWSSMKDIYIKNVTGSTNTGGMYFSGYQWCSFERIHIDGFGRYCLCIDSQSPETWEVLALFKSCLFMQGNSAPTGISGSVLVKQTNRWQNNSFSALGVAFDQCHFAIYPGNQIYTNETRAFQIDPALNGVDLSFTFVNDCLFENHRKFFSVAKDAIIYIHKPAFYGNGRTVDVIENDNYQAKYTIDSPYISNCTNGIMTVGLTTIKGCGKVIGVSGTLLQPSNNTRMYGQLQGINHDYKATLTPTLDGTSIAVTGQSFYTAPSRFDITPTWNTTVWVSGISTTGFTINFGTPVPAGSQRVYVYASTQR